MKYFILLWLGILSAGIGVAQNASSTVTFFREKQSNFKHNEQFKKDFVGMGFHWPVYMDGILLVELRRDRMASFAIPSGHHEFKTEKSERLSVEVSPGQHIFVRPVMYYKEHSHTASLKLEVVDCKEFIDRTTGIRASNVEDIFSGKIISEKAFADSCSKESQTSHDLGN